MGIGAIVRGLFGPFERQAAEAYRAAFIDIDAFVSQVQAWCPDARTVLEVGCGEGAVSERLAAAYPDAEITGVDITPRLGRLYRGPRDAVRFRQCTVQDVAQAEPGRYDLVILCDVLHHVPEEHRVGLLQAIGTAMADDGCFVIKEWERTATPIYWLAYGCDRWITGDRIAYATCGELRTRLAQSFGAKSLAAEARIQPWRNNLAILVR